ncbi:MAG: AAA family ATPase [Chloroflexi bacterium]|nr:AAA family ATPase [Chloroflexota bacterium]
MSNKNTYTIAVSGKGGTGKTVISSLIVRLLSDNSDIRLLAIDADPATSLPYALGVRFDKTVGDIREKTFLDAKNPSSAVGNTPLDMLLENELKRIMVGTPDFSLLVMGRPEGPGCYCLINNMLRYIMDKVSRRFDVTVIDCEAGLEHLSRRTIRNVDLLFMVTDPTARGMNTAKSIKSLAQGLDITVGQLCLVMNKVTPDDKELYDKLDDICATIPLDGNVTRYDREGTPIAQLPDDSPVVKAVAELLDKTYYADRPQAVREA